MRPKGHYPSVLAGQSGSEMGLADRITQAQRRHGRQEVLGVIHVIVRSIHRREEPRRSGSDYTLIPYRGKASADSPRYRAIGNSMAVPVMRWIGERIQMVETLMGGRK